MKFAVPILLLSTVVSAMEFPGFSAESKAGQNLILSSRQLEDEIDSFVASHSIVFDGCHNTTSWADGYYNVVPLVRFRLCPTKYIHSNTCYSKKVGEYLVSMTTFLDSYMEYQMETLKQNCENLREACGCDGDNDDCQYHCYNTYNGVTWSQCSQEQGEEERYGECQAFEIDNNDENGRRLNDGAKYYMGPYCGPSGANIFLTLFSDQYCSNPLQNAASVYSSGSGGQSMPYQYGSSNGMVTKGKWMSCAEQGDDDNNNDNQDGDEVIQMCEEAYQGAAKCESNMTSLTYPVTNGCNYIAQMKAGVSGTSAYQMSSQLSGSSSTAFFLVFGAMAVLAVIYVAVHFSKRNDKSPRAAPLVEVELAA